MEKRSGDAAIMHEQDLIFQNKSMNAPVYKRSSLRPGNTLQGPALIADLESTTLLPPAFSLRVDAFLNMIIHRKTK
jgi:N-methylhydantoinase A